MTIEITPASVTITIAVGGAAAKIVHWLVGLALERRDAAIKAAFDRAVEAEETAGEAIKVALTAKEREMDELRGAYRAIKETQGKLFEKHDFVVRELNEYKLHVAERYVGEEKLEKLFAPLVNRLEGIETEMRRRAQP